ncbi:hypothetical protein [Rathayibacter sp. AY1D3]|uniref:hypothetical protein n=1 Tax=Rathayibacter sp. AY1D3 TaxID=2080544 RepID=UPI000CE8F7D5|nr:hypothetical protein [Rathayibacter sp. AY1D3]PPH85156.1 hypothetical protein C5C64_16925 [Rathayibacter sp. AY1D3]
MHRWNVLVLTWCRWYTQDLAPEVAAMRRDEIASDLHEHAAWADARGQHPARTARQIGSRTLRGVGSDLMWRRARLRNGNPEGLFTARVRSASAALWALVLAIVLTSTAVGGWASVRVAGGSLIPTSTSAPLYAATVLAAAASLLLLHQRTRTAGAVLGAVAVAVLPTVVINALWFVSASVTVLRTMPYLDLGLLALGNMLGLVLLAAVLCWSIRRPRTVGASS